MDRHQALLASLAADVIREQYDEVTLESFKNPRVTCKWCLKAFTANISRQKRHLIGCLPYRRGKTAPRQQSIASAITIQAAPKGFQERATKMAATAIFTMGLPFTMLENPAMKAFLHELNPTYKPAGEEAIKGWLTTI